MVDVEGHTEIVLHICVLILLYLCPHTATLPAMCADTRTYVWYLNARGSSHFGYPDASYFQRVKDELALKGVTPRSHTQLPGLSEASSQPGHSHTCQVF